MTKLPSDATLLVIDVQKAFDNPVWGQRNNPDAEKRISELIDAWRACGRPIIHAHHVNPRPGSLFNPGSPGVELKPEGLPFPGEPVLSKNVNSAFIGTDLETRLRSSGVTTVVIVGMTTDHCISTTARMAANLGFQAVVVSDATATFERSGYDGVRYSADQMHNTALASLNTEFATIVNTRQMVASLTQNAGAT
jgi:Amidases related to nicotinamidase